MQRHDCEDGIGTRSELADPAGYRGPVKASGGRGLNRSCDAVAACATGCNCCGWAVFWAASDVSAPGAVGSSGRRIVWSSPQCVAEGSSLSGVDVSKFSTVSGVEQFDVFSGLA